MKSRVLQVFVFVFIHGTVWKYKDEGTDQGTIWRDGGFDDSGWLSAPGKLRYRYPPGGPNNTGIATVVKCVNTACTTFSNK